MLEKFSKKFGFTQTEITVILFLAALFIIGFIYIELIKDESNPNDHQFDYSKEDSLFNLYSSRNSAIDSDDTLIKSELETKYEVLQLSDSINYVKKDISSLTERSIDINKADLGDFMKLPGIGEKTAERIIELRTKRGRFKSIQELMDVKGIGGVKFSKIEKYLYVK